MFGDLVNLVGSVVKGSANLATGVISGTAGLAAGVLEEFASILDGVPGKRQDQAKEILARYERGEISKAKAKYELGLLTD